jgi:hypothetical protein
VLGIAAAPCSVPGDRMVVRTAVLWAHMSLMLDISAPRSQVGGQASQWGRRPARQLCRYVRRPASQFGPPGPAAGGRPAVGCLLRAFRNLREGSEWRLGANRGMHVSLALFMLARLL